MQEAGRNGMIYRLRLVQDGGSSAGFETGNKRKCGMNKDDGKRFLEEVTDKIKEQLRALRSSIREGEKDIAQMQEYYWENYTEMDQYGYEDYDNQQALLKPGQRQPGEPEAEKQAEENAGFPFFRKGGFSLFRGRGGGTLLHWNRELLRRTWEGAP